MVQVSATGSRKQDATPEAQCAGLDGPPAQALRVRLGASGDAAAMGKKSSRTAPTALRLNDGTLRQLLAAYVARDEDAFDVVYDMTRDEPELCWRFLELARASDLSDRDLAYISAGPFEDMMGHHGAAFIDRVETAARQDIKMRYLIGTVWQGGMAPVVWDGLERLRRQLGIGSY